MKPTLSKVRATRPRWGRVRPAALATLAAVATMASLSIAPTAEASTLSAASTTTITWWVAPISYGGADLRPVLIKAFEKANPTIKVTLETAPTSTDTNRSDLVTTISGGSSTPDVFNGDVIWPGQFGAHQLALPLSKYLPSSFFSRFAPGLVAGASYKGVVYGAPFFQDQGFLYYRSDLLKAAHMAVPKTWEQLESDAATLVKEGKVKYGYVWEGASYEGGTCDFMEYYADLGGQILNSSDNASALNVPDVVKTLTFMRSLVTSGASPSSVSTFQEPQAMGAFQDGQAAFMRNWDYAWGESQSKGMASIGKVGVAPLPTFANGVAYPGYSNIGGWNLYINPHSKNVQADLKFIEFMTDVQAQTIEATQFSEIPTNEAVRSAPAVQKLSPPDSILAKTRLVPRPAQNPNYPKISEAIYTNMNAALGGSASPTSAAHSMASQLKSAVTGG